MKHERLDLLILILWPIIAFMLSFVWPINTLLSILLFYIIPCTYLSLRKPGYVRKAALFALVGAIPLMFVIDYIAHLTQTWYIESSFPHILGYVAVEALVWVFFWVYFTVIFYEYFLHHRVESRLWHPHMKRFILIILVVLAAFAFALVAFSAVLHIPYFYLVLGLAGVILPLVIEAFGHARVFSTFFGVGMYFIYVHLLYEIAALHLGWWTFPGTEFVGYLQLFGVVMPFEEFFFWIFLGSIAPLVYFELFDDTQKA